MKHTHKFLKNLLLLMIALLATYCFMLEVFGVPIIAFAFSFPFMLTEFGFYLDYLVDDIARSQK